MEERGPGPDLLEETMKEILFLVGLVFTGAGCVTAPNSIMPVNTAAQPSERVTLGMTRAMVSSIMDARVTIGYEVDPDTGVLKSVEAQNLYSSEIVKINELAHQIDRYIVRPSTEGARMAETALFPVVYRYGLVVAVGREGLASLTASRSPKAVK
jgi:hypothetical protein